jgi:rhodanese-related sulfurtransferase
VAAPRPDVDAFLARQLQAQGVVLLDVREPDEWNAGHAPGATHRPLGQLDPGDLDSAASYVTVCRSGGRSAKAAAALHEAGFDVANFAGGMSDWQHAGLPVIGDDDAPGYII